MVFTIARRSMPSLQVCVMISVIGFAQANIIADLIYANLNPRIRVYDYIIETYTDFRY